MKRAFTLLELLLTLLVCLILAAILTPVFSPPREGGGPSCLSNVRQVGRTQAMYTQDYDGVLPPMQTPEILKTALMPYIKYERAFSCRTLRSPYLPLALLSNVPVWRIEYPAQAEFLRDPDYHPTSKPGTRRINIGFVDGHAKLLSAPPPPITLLSSPKPPAKPAKKNRASH